MNFYISKSFFKTKAIQNQDKSDFPYINIITYAYELLIYLFILLRLVYVLGWISKNRIRRTLNSNYFKKYIIGFSCHKIKSNYFNQLTICENFILYLYFVF